MKKSLFLILVILSALYSCESSIPSKNHIKGKTYVCSSSSFYRSYSFSLTNKCEYVDRCSAWDIKDDLYYTTDGINVMIYKDRENTQLHSYGSYREDLEVLMLGGEWYELKK